MWWVGSYLFDGLHNSDSLSSTRRSKHKIWGRLRCTSYYMLYCTQLLRVSLQLFVIQPEHVHVILIQDIHVTQFHTDIWVTSRQNHPLDNIFRFYQKAMSFLCRIKFIWHQYHNYLRNYVTFGNLIVNSVTNVNAINDVMDGKRVGDDLYDMETNDEKYTK